MIKCITIDDEPLALRQIKNYIRRIPALSLEAEFKSAIDARAYMAGNSVDLIFVDINMPDLTGVEFVRELEQRTMIIFTTAYSEYAIEGYRLDAIDYLLKPFSFDDFSRAVNKACSLYELYVKHLDSEQEQAAENIAEAEVEESAGGNSEYISIKADYKVSLVRLADIVYIESDSEYVRLHFADGTSIMTLFRMKKMETVLPSDSFMRVHRSYIVNLKCVTGYARGRVYLNNNEYLPIGENYKEQFLDYVSKNYPSL